MHKLLLPSYTTGYFKQWQTLRGIISNRVSIHDLVITLMHNCMEVTGMPIPVPSHDWSEDQFVNWFSQGIGQFLISLIAHLWTGYENRYFDTMNERSELSKCDIPSMYSQTLKVTILISTFVNNWNVLTSDLLSQFCSLFYL